eukprot:2531973-Alexandrium_andersonii.AAC.1
MSRHPRLTSDESPPPMGSSHPAPKTTQSHDQQNSGRSQICAGPVPPVPCFSAGSSSGDESTPIKRG